VVAEAAAGIDAVRHLLLISSYLPEPGESLSSFGDPDPAPFLDIDAEGGTFGVGRRRSPKPSCTTASNWSMKRCITSLARACRSRSSRCKPQPGSSCRRLTSSAVRIAALRPNGSESSPRAQTVVELDAGHHPFLAQPQKVADLVLEIS
jgi:hypothetical protein